MTLSFDGDIKDPSSDIYIYMCVCIYIRAVAGVYFWFSLLRGSQ